MSNGIYKYLASAAFLVFWLATLYMVKKWPRSNGLTFSKHAAANKQAYKLFAVAVTIETVLYSIFVYKWFIPNFHMTLTFLILIWLILIGHLFTGLVPETKGVAKSIHWTIAYLVALLFIPATFLLTTTETIPKSGRIMAGICVTLMVLIALGLWVKPTLRKYKLILQGVYIATLPLTLIVVSYLH